MEQFTGGEVAVETLLANGIDTVFGIPGGHNFPVYAALARRPQVRHVLGRHEQGLGYMAEGYARASGKIAAVAITSGPAVANVAGALGQATTDTAPILVIASTPRAELLGKNRGGLHDLNNSLELARSVSRHVEHATTVEEISPKLAGLIRKLREERPGGAYLQVPADVLAARGQVQIAVNPPSKRRQPDSAGLKAAVELLERAERPLIIAGTGAVISEAGQVICQLAERLGAVVSTTTLARGLLSANFPWVVFPDGALATEFNEVFDTADVILGVGTMFKQEDCANWTIKFSGKLIHIDIDPAEFGRSHKTAVALHADARAACEGLLTQLRRPTPAPASWRAHAAELHRMRLGQRRVRQGVDMAFAEAFREALPADVMLFADRCNIGYWTYRCLPFYQPRTFQFPMGYGGLGSVLPQAIGAKLACPERRMVAALGDGGIQFVLGELAVAVQEQTPITIVVSNNQCYGAIRAGLMRNYGGMDFGTKLSGPDYSAIARAYGIAFVRATTRDEFLRILPDEINRNRLGLIEFQNDLGDP